MRLIDADSLIESIERLNRLICDDYHNVLDQIIQDISNEPTIEPKKGKWVQGEFKWKCSECGCVCEDGKM